MNHKLPIEQKQGFLQKVIIFFKKLFYKNNYKKLEKSENFKMNIHERSINVVPKETSKKEFFDLYEKAKNGEVDLYDIDKNDLMRMCKMIEEEIKIVDREIIETRKKNKEIKEKIESYNT